jgi:hypothetical protein
VGMPEADARQLIDAALVTRGWVVHDVATANVHARRGVAVREYLLAESIQRDKVRLDLFWQKDENLEDSANLPRSDQIMAELRAALSQFEALEASLVAQAMR